MGWPWVNKTFKVLPQGQLFSCVHFSCWCPVESRMMFAQWLLPFGGGDKTDCTLHMGNLRRLCQSLNISFLTL